MRKMDCDTRDSLPDLEGVNRNTQFDYDTLLYFASFYFTLFMTVNLRKH